jgi:UDP-2,3-diacylglucosamine pyrophosphatase LpxH
VRLLVLSDTHFEFHKDHGESFVDWIWNENKKNPPDVVVLAGDISDVAGLRNSIGMFAEAFPSDITFVIGNHECYNTTPKNAFKRAEKIEDDFERVYWLEPGEPPACNYYQDGEIRIHGGTLWFPECETDTCKRFMNDFQAIRDFEPWVYRQHELTVKDLAKYVRRGDVVVTHHMPSEKSIHKWYADSPINSFFASDQDWIITSRKPKYWIHGHGHNSCDYKIGDTRIICNPFGYVKSDENKNFNPSLVIEA